MQKIAIIIPCYNEEKRLSGAALEELHNTTNVHIYLCNDGSTDGTAALIDGFANTMERCFAIQYSKNQGKANTIYKSANALLAKNDYTHIGYFDADFSTPVSEMKRMLERLEQVPSQFIIGSRVKLLNNDIQRKTHRHFIGRAIITLVNIRLKLGIYDTQCGAKLFPVTIAAEGFTQPFKTSWLFDIELFIRLKKKGLLIQGEEFPLRHWKDVDGSKLGWKTSFKILKELLILQKL
ncbi:glycosyltransferase [Flavobacterium psychrotrophum]|uniref:glycosyltransferase n=1 Tax=Flavobacterium psychrotrophum TaxID=2294119 RepID=UPI000E3212D4|nr:glycosyltransferase [Flavobacterium psychrotrophum]